VSKPKAKQHEIANPIKGKVFSARFVIAVLFFVVGVAWIAYYYTQVRVVPPETGGSPAWMADLGDWNYLIGFGLIMLGLALAAHPSTPLGRGRAVPIMMLACFLVGLLWICTFYVFSDDISSIPVFNDLGQYNLVVGIALMAVGFTYATRWE